MLVVCGVRGNEFSPYDYKTGHLRASGIVGIGGTQGCEEQRRLPRTVFEGPLYAAILWPRNSLAFAISESHFCSC